MTRLLLSVAILCSILPAQITFQRTYGGRYDDFGYSVAQTADGGYIAAGYTGSFGAGDDDVWLVKTDSLGDTLWTRTFGGTGWDRGYSVAQTGDGGYIVAGYTDSDGARDQDIWLIKTDASGDTVWTRTYGGEYYEYGFSVVQAQDGGYVVAGCTDSYGASDVFDIWLVRTDASGDTLWTRTYGGMEDDYGHSVVQTRDGGYIVAGSTESYGPGDVAVLLVRTDASGDAVWTRTFGGAAQEYGYSVVQTRDGGYIVAGRTSSFGAGLSDAWLIKTDASGDTLWTRTFGGRDHDYGYSVAQTRDSGFVVVGCTYSLGDDSGDVWLVRTDPSGDTAWTRTFGGPGWDRGHSVALTGDGGYVVGGLTESFGAGEADAWLIKTDSLGRVGIAEPKPPAPVAPAQASLLPRARLLSELRLSPDLTLFDASGRRVLDPYAITAGVLFLRSAATTRRVLVV